MENEKLKIDISEDVLKSFKSHIESISKLPEDLKISTITITCNFDSEFDIINIGKYIDLSMDGIVYVKYGNDDNNFRSIIEQKIKKKKKKKKVKKVFYNQATVKINTKSEKPTNVKLFKNGSIQMTGCKNVINAIRVLTILCKELNKVKGVLDKKNMNKIICKKFVTKPENITMSTINKFQIGMINSNFNIGFKIDRDELYNVILNQDIECTYEPCVHACVNIKYKHTDDKKVSIFVFESGAIIITGAKNQDHITGAYEFITKKLYENYNTIIKHDLSDLLKSVRMKEIMNDKN